MTEERFEDLVNLYLDNEISRHELDELKRVIKENLARRKQFERACQLHQAARKALVGKPQDGKNPSTDTRTDKRTGNASHAGTRKGTQPSLSQMQDRARVNATVPVQAERQASAGAAATVKVEEISSKKRRRSRHAAWAGPMSAQGKLLLAGAALVMGGWYFFYTPSQVQNFDAYTPDVGELPAMPKNDKGSNTIADLSNLSDGGAVQPFSGSDEIQARIKAAALTGNTVVERMLMNQLATQSTNTGANGTAQWSMHVTEQMYIQTRTLNATTSVEEQMQRSLESTPALAPVTPPPAIEVVPENNLTGNGTLEKDLQP